MKKKIIRHRFLAVFIALLLLWVGCQNESAHSVLPDFDSEGAFDNVENSNAANKNGRTGIILDVEQKAQRTFVNIGYIPYVKSENGPRIAEVYLAYSKNVHFIAAEKGDATIKADKQLIVQNLKNKNQLRLVILASDNTNELDTGRLATLTFEKTDSEDATLRVLTDKPVFAPTEANEGLSVSDPLTF